MIDLRERLSEFSYGYGVTKEVEALLASVGMRSVPFQPSLVQEKKVGFDVSFNKPGIPLFLQFKLGQALQRFVRSDKSSPAPYLERPFFRFGVDTAEPDGQFEALLKAETDGADTYYVAPRFADWPQYVRFFEKGEVLDNSVIIAPSAIRAALFSQNYPDGFHRIVYDLSRVYVCSAPVSIGEMRPELLRNRLLTLLSVGGSTLGELLHRVYAGLDDRAWIRRAVHSKGDEPTVDVHEELDERVSVGTTRAERDRRFEQLRERSASDEDAIAATLGLEFWGLGVQLLFAVKPD